MGIITVSVNDGYTYVRHVLVIVICLMVLVIVICLMVMKVHLHSMPHTLVLLY